MLGLVRFIIRLYQCHAFAVAFVALLVLTAVAGLPDLFEIFSGSGGDAWRSVRKLAGFEAPRSLPTMGWMRVRPGAAPLGRRISE